MICDYGCGQEGNYQFKNGRWCCSKHHFSCPNIIKKRLDGITPTKRNNTRKKLSEKLKGHYVSEETKRKISESRKGQPSPRKGKKHTKKSREKISKSTQGRIPWNKGKKGYMRHTNEFKKRMSLNNKHTITVIKKLYPFFSKIEEMRYNPDKPEEKEIQVHCKNHNCPNSKEQGGWFTPEYEQFRSRINALEKPDGNDGLFFYCSESCKNICPLYKFRYFENQNQDKNYTDEEYKTFREHVLKRDNYKCQYCGEPADHVHHERPQKLEPFFSLDPDLAWSVCSECHYKYGHQNECSTGQLAQLVC